MYCKWAEEASIFYDSSSGKWFGKCDLRERLRRRRRRRRGDGIEVEVERGEDVQLYALRLVLLCFHLALLVFALCSLLSAL